MEIEDIIWNWEPAVLVHGDTTEEEAFKAARAHLGVDELDVGPVRRFRKSPDGSGEFDMRITEIPEDSTNLRGTFKARLVQ